VKTEKNVFYDTKILKDEVLTGNVRKSKRIKNVVSDVLTQRYGSIEQTEGVHVYIYSCMCLCVCLCIYIYVYI
jgi:hypothetical protein